MKTSWIEAGSGGVSRLLEKAAAVLLGGAALCLAACSDNGTTSAAAGAAGSSAGAGTGGAAGDTNAGGTMSGPGGSGGSSGASGAGGSGGPIEVGPSAFAIEEVDHHRNRLLDTLAQRRGAADRCALWGAMTIVEIGTFLTHTDMLGHRSCMENSSVPEEQMNNGQCDASECRCTTSLPCACAAGSEMALDHVFKVWAVNGTDPACCSGTNCCNGDGEWHRTFFSADDKLIGYLREIQAGLPEWDESHDFAGPHEPFTQSSETQQGTPRGQIHFWSQDSEVSVLARNGVSGVSDPHIVELDNDYNILHDSNSEGFYSNKYGRAAYKNHWNLSGAKNRGDGLATTFLGNGAPDNIPEIAGDEIWSPACGPVIDPSGVVPGGGGKAGELKSGAKVTISGSGFAESGNRVHVRSRSIAVRIDASSPLLLSESSSSIVFQLPKDIGAGEGFVYVESNGVLTNLAPVTLNP